jgi:hypothetical protein
MQFQRGHPFTQSHIACKFLNYALILGLSDVTLIYSCNQEKATGKGEKDPLSGRELTAQPKGLKGVDLFIYF